MADQPNGFVRISLGNIITVATVVGSAVGIYTQMRLTDADVAQQLSEMKIEMCEIRVVLGGGDTNGAILSCRDRVAGARKIEK